MNYYFALLQKHIFSKTPGKQEKRLKLTCKEKFSQPHEVRI